MLRYNIARPIALTKMTLEKLTDLATERRNLFLILLGIVLYVAFIGLRDVWYPDEPDIAEVALSMYLSGDWISPRRMGEIWIDYTPMIYWIGNISSHLFDSMNAFTLRLPNALVAIVIGLITGATAARWFDARTGFWAGFSLMTSLLFVYEANSYRPDILFTVFITSGLILYVDGTLDKPRHWLRIAGFACLGGAMLSKGILGLLLPGLVLTLWHAFRKEWKLVLSLAPLSLVSLAVFLPWVVATASAMGWDNLAREFYEQNFARFQSGFRGHSQPVWYYLRNFWLDFMPWSWFAPAALYWTFKSGMLKNPRVQLLLWWFGTFFVFLSFAETKRQLYMLPAFPAMALILAPWLTTIGKSDPTRTQVLRGMPKEKVVHIYSIILAAVFGLLGIVFVAAAALFDLLDLGKGMNHMELQVVSAIRWPLALLGITLAAAGVWLWLAWKEHDTRDLMRRIGVSHVAMYIVILGLVMPQLAATKTYAPQGQWIRDQIGSDQNTIGMVYPGGGGIRKRGAFGFETGGAMVELLESADDVEQFFARFPDSLVLVESRSEELIFGDARDASTARTQHELWVGKTLYYVVRRNESLVTPN